MTLATTANRVSYTGNGVTTAFAVSFEFFDASELKVLEVVIATGAETVKTLTTHYTVSGGAGSTGTVTMLTAPASTVYLVIYKDPPRTQMLDLVADDDMPAEDVEARLDRNVSMTQRVHEMAARALRQPEGDITDIAAIPGKVDRASKYLAFNASSNPIAAAPPEGGNVVSAFMVTVLDDANAAAALTTLGVSSFMQTVLDDTTAAAARTTLGVVNGKIAQVVNTQTGAVATGTTVTPFDDTIPQNTEGDEYMTLAITPTNAASTLIIEVTWVGSSSAAADVPLVVALFQDSTAGALAAAVERQTASAGEVTCNFIHKMTAGTVSATTFKVRAGGGSAGTVTFNGNSGARRLGGVMASSITITEILP